VRRCPVDPDAWARGARASESQWLEPADLEGLWVRHDVIRIGEPAEFASGVFGVEFRGTLLQATDTDVPGSGCYYLVRATNACSAGEGRLSTPPGGTEPAGRQGP
jgi:hypothetical protein